MRTSKRRILGEEDVIHSIWKILSNDRGRKAGDPFDDDVSWVSIDEKKKFLISKCDMFVSSTDAPKSMKPSQMAMKAVTSCVSDFAAKGVEPLFCLVSLAIPKKNANKEFVEGLATGLKEASRHYGVRVLAGDTNAAESEITIDCAMFGFANDFVKRSGARSGDLVGTTGKFGLQPSGLSILQESNIASDPAFRRKAIDSVLNSRAKLGIGLRISGFLTSSIDSSDGLAISLYHLAEASNISIELQSIPLAEGVEEFAKKNSKNVTDLELFGGEEYEIVCTYPKSRKSTLEKLGITTIGEVKPASRGSRPTVSFKGKHVARKGWTHFKLES